MSLDGPFSAGKQASGAQSAVFSTGGRTRSFTGESRDDPSSPFAALPKEAWMYLHIGQNELIPEKRIIGIFDLDKVTCGKRGREYLKAAGDAGVALDLSGDLPRSIVVCDHPTTPRSSISLSSPPPRWRGGRAPTAWSCNTCGRTPNSRRPKDPIFWNTPGAGRSGPDSDPGRLCPPHSQKGAFFHGRKRDSQPHCGGRGKRV